MKTLLFGLAWCFVFWLVPAGASDEVLPQKFRVATYNLFRFSGNSKGTNAPGIDPSPKEQEARDAIAHVLKRVNPDILVVQEIGDKRWLENLRRDLEAVGVVYPAENCEFVFGNDRHNHLAVLAKYPWKSASWNVRGDFLTRGFISSRFKMQDGEDFYVFPVHLKSQIGTKTDPKCTKRRSRELLVLRSLISQGVPAELHERRDFFAGMIKIFEQYGVPFEKKTEFDGRDLTTEYWERPASTPELFVILGDFNTPPDAPEIKIFREKQLFAVPVEAVPAVMRKTADLSTDEGRRRNPRLDNFSYVIKYAYSPNKNLRERNIAEMCGQLDQIFLSPQAFKRRKNTPAIICNYDYSWLGSDHRCLYIDFDFSE
ncbi:MAG: endonuclease/exonuclease/phosphatase family protein [Opitutales bacterium]|nr:endonuclease/exonuclease/phosphatase family protein [Opitutales bacterium]